MPAPAERAHAERAQAERTPRERVRHEGRVALAVLLAGAPAVVAAGLLAWRARLPELVWWTAGPLVLGAWVGGALAVRAQVARPLQVLANMLGAMREGDFSMRSRGADPRSALGLALHEANALAATLREERLRSLESAALLRRVMAEIDVAVFAFDELGALRLVNRQGERLLARPAERLLGRDADELGLADFLAGADGVPLPGARLLDGGAGSAAPDGTPNTTAGSAPNAPRVISATFAGASGRWEVRRGEFRQGGRPHALLLVTDLSETLRAEERAAWQRLVRVLSHEINNTLAPVKSIAASLLRRVRNARARGAADASGLPPAGLTTSGIVVAAGATPPPADGAVAADDDFTHGLSVITERADALARFIGAYARLSRLPPPAKAPVQVGGWVRRVAALERRVPVEVAAGAEVAVHADPDQLDQLLINLVRNAADAALETGGGVQVAWRASAAQLVVTIDDEGPGLADTANLFVPFYSTKPEGSGIGLALCRQIAEGHGGTLSLANRAEGRGCRATLVLPR